MAYQALQDLDVRIGHGPTVVLSNPIASQLQPQIFEAVLLPGLGMNVLQLKARFPHSEKTIDLFSAPAIKEAHAHFSAGDAFGNRSFQSGGALLAPFVNRIRGKLSGSNIETQIAKKTLKLPANWKGSQPNAEPHALHGLILKSAFEVMSLTSGDRFAEVEAQLEAGDFGVGWPGQICIDVRARIQGPLFELEMVAENTGREAAPISLGWHPYLQMPSGRREQLQLSVPASGHVSVNNSDDVFPTGEIESVQGTEHDFRKARALGDKSLDDCFVDLLREGVHPPTVELIDAAAGFGLRLRAVSPEIKAIQVYAPRDQNFVAIEPQFSVADPYSDIWKRDTGVVWLEPGARVRYAVELEVFVPESSQRR